MILPINSKYRIRGTEHCWEIQRRRTRKGKDTWESWKYCTSIEHAVNVLGEHMVRTCDAKTLTEALREIDRVVTTLSRALTPRWKVGCEWRVAALTFTAKDPETSAEVEHVS